MKATSTLPLETFRLHPFLNRRPYFSVHLAHSLGELRMEMGLLGVRPKKQLGGACISVHATGKHKDLMGLILLARTHLGAGLVTHELAHAAFRACEFSGIQVRHWEHTSRNGSLGIAIRNEERFCSILDDLSCQFWRIVYDQRLAATG